MSKPLPSSPAADDPRIAAALDQARRFLGPRLESVAGAHVAGEIPVSETALNRIIAEKLQTSNGPVMSAELQVRAHDELAVRIRLRRPSFAPTIIVTFYIERQPAPPASMELVMKWSLPGMGLLKPLVAPVLSFFKKTPPGIRVDGDRVVVDFATLARERGAGALLEFVTGLRIATRDRELVVSFDLGVASSSPRSEPTPNRLGTDSEPTLNRP
jgi:hypothetical protein